MWFLRMVCRKEACLGRLPVMVEDFAAPSTPVSFILSRDDWLDRMRIGKEEDDKTNAWRMSGPARRRARERASRRGGLIMMVSRRLTGEERECL